MRLSSIREFDIGIGKGRFRQTTGCILGPDLYYATLRPEGAEPNDGEDILVLRDDRFGEGFQKVDLDMQWPAAMIGGGLLEDRANAILLLHEGYVLFIRDGHIDIEKIPDVGNFSDNPNDFGDVSAMAIHDGKLFVAGSDGRIFSRIGVSEWITLLDGDENSEVFFTTICIDGAGGIVAAGEKDYRGVILEYAVNGQAKWIDTGSQSLIASTIDGQGRIWLCGWSGALWFGDVENGMHSMPVRVEGDFVAIGHHANTLFIAGSGTNLWKLEEDEIREVSAPLGSAPLAVISFENMDLGLSAQGENGFGVFDGMQWNRINVPW
ncbi:hypothetical protein ACMA5I_10930 [Paracoccaceae bacterium GXU_MW_L88]